MKITIRTKLLLGFGVVLFLTSAVNIFSLFQMDHLANLTVDIYNHPLQVTRAVLRADGDIVRMHRSMKDVVLADNLTGTLAAEEQVALYEAQVYEQLAIVEEWILGDEGLALVAQTIQDFADWQEIRQEVIALTKDGNTTQAAEITKGRGAEHVGLLEARMSSLRDYAAGKATGMYSSAQQTRSSVIRTSIIALVLALLGSFVLAMSLSTTLSRTIGAVAQASGELAQGDLRSDVIVQSSDEVGDLSAAMNITIASWRKIISNLRDDSSNMASTAAQLASSANQMELTSQDQANQIVNISSAMEEMSRTIQEVANNAETTNQAASASSAIAQDGAALVIDAVTGINRANDSLEQLKTRSKEIGKITDFIQDISSQTGILALNAAIEAAAAGENGARFNVIADEIRKLAGRTAEAIAEISELIGAVQGDVQTTVAAMDEGTTLVEQVGQKLTEIVEASLKASDMMQLVSSSAIQQTATSEEIAATLENIVAGSQENVATTRETAKVGVEISNLAESLDSATQQFRIN